MRSGPRKLALETWSWLSNFSMWFAAANRNVTWAPPWTLLSLQQQRQSEHSPPKRSHRYSYCMFLAADVGSRWVGSLSFGCRPGFSILNSPVKFKGTSVSAARGNGNDSEWVRTIRVHHTVLHKTITRGADKEENLSSSITGKHKKHYWCVN